MPEEWTAWAVTARGAIRVGRVICAATAVGWVVVATVVVTNLARGRDVPHVSLLLIPGIPMLVVAHLWAGAIILGRRNRAGGGRPKWRFRATERDPDRFFFEGLPRGQVNALRAVFLLGVVTAMTAVPYFWSGSPASPSRNCRYRLVDHGAYTCVSRSTYLAAGAASQRFVSGILGAFFVMQFGVAAAELRRRRIEQGAG